MRLARRRVVLLPHMASAYARAASTWAKEIVNIGLDGHKPPDRVLPSML